MRLIVGLGNPGKEYEKTRHNVGFNVVDLYLKQNKLELDKSKFNGKYTKTTINDEEVIFLEPQTYMNNSGESVSAIMKFYKIDINDILVIQDDLDMEIGKIKLKEKSSSGGHNGIKSIEECLGTDNYKRLKIGISNNKDIDTKDYVLGNISKEDKDTLNNLYKDLCGVVDDYFHISFPELMNKYNRKNR